jgi:hypothetical protein
VNEKVDVYCDNGSHKGTVKDILENSRYAVGFDGECSEGIVSEQCNLRLHREWDEGSWIPPLLDQVFSTISFLLFFCFLCACVFWLKLIAFFLLFFFYIYNREMRRIVLRYLLVFFEHGLW